MTIPGTDGFADHTYRTVRNFGNYIQVLAIESEGTTAPAPTAKQVTLADEGADSLGERLASALR